MYGFSEFTSSLNELEEGVAPTDCRFRPDQRFMEQQDFDKANEEKVHVQHTHVHVWQCLHDFHALAYISITLDREIFIVKIFSSTTFSNEN